MFIASYLFAYFFRLLTPGCQTTCHPGVRMLEARVSEELSPGCQQTKEVGILNEIKAHSIKNIVYVIPNLR